MIGWFMGNGQFEKGFDSRRGRKKVLFRGMTISEMAQLHTPDAINMLAALVNNTELNGDARTDGKKYPTSSRVAAANTLLSYGHGKPETMIKIQELVANDTQSLTHIPTDRLVQLIDAEAESL